MSEFLVFGHRGAMGHAPENTLLSVRTALEMGVGGVEVDVHLHEGRLIVLHDEKLDRTTDGIGRFDEYSLDEIRRLDAGLGERIPLLEEVIDAVPEGVILNVELKGGGTGSAAASLLRARIEERDWSGERFLVSSFDEGELRRFHDHAPDIRIGILAGRALTEADLEKAVDMGAYSMNLDVRLAEGGVVKAARDLGLVVLVYTVNSPGVAVRLEEMGVRGVFSDFPDRILKRMGGRGIR